MKCIAILIKAKELSVIKPGHLYKQLGGQTLRHRFNSMHFHCNRSLGQIYYSHLCISLQQEG